MSQFEYIAIHHADGKVSRMQFVIRASAECFDARGAADAGFTFDHDTQEWTREATRASIQREIGRTAFPPGIAAPDAWKVINASDLPNVRLEYAQIPERKQLQDR